MPVVRNRIRGAGSLGGLYTALMAAPAEQLVMMACDMPFLTAPFLTERLDADGRLLLNVNTPDDYARAIA